MSRSGLVPSVHSTEKFYPACLEQVFDIALTGSDLRAVMERCEEGIGTTVATDEIHGAIVLCRFGQVFNQSVQSISDAVGAA